MSLRPAALCCCLCPADSMGQLLTGQHQRRDRRKAWRASYVVLAWGVPAEQAHLSRGLGQLHCCHGDHSQKQSQKMCTLVQGELFEVHELCGGGASNIDSAHQHARHAVVIEAAFANQWHL